jgi:hypothetical protein
MYQLLIYSGQDQYEYVPRLCKQVYNSDLHYLKIIAEEWREHFNAKAINYLHVVIVLLDPEGAGNSIVVNEFGKHPLKTRIEINEKAKAAKLGQGKKKAADYGEELFNSLVTDN